MSAAVIERCAGVVAVWLLLATACAGLDPGELRALCEMNRSLHNAFHSDFCSPTVVVCADSSILCTSDKGHVRFIWCASQSKCLAADKASSCVPCSSLGNDTCDSTPQCMWCPASGRCTVASETCRECSGAGTEEQCGALAGCRWCAESGTCADRGVACTACLRTRLRDVCLNDTSCAWCGSRALCLGSGDRCPGCSALARGSCTLGCQWCAASLTCTDASLSSECSCSATCSGSPGCRSCATTHSCTAVADTCPSCLSFTSAAECARGSCQWCNTTEQCVPSGQLCPLGTHCSVVLHHWQLPLAHSAALCRGGRCTASVRMSSGDPSPSGQRTVKLRHDGHVSATAVHEWVVAQLRHPGLPLQVALHEHSEESAAECAVQMRGAARENVQASVQVSEAAHHWHPSVHEPLASAEQPGQRSPLPRHSALDPHHAHDVSLRHTSLSRVLRHAVHATPRAPHCSSVPAPLHSLHVSLATVSFPRLEHGTQLPALSAARHLDCEAHQLHPLR
eukprot:m51a1_g10023 hypothetical protein (509) ;mRNA; r:81137-89398